MFKRKKGAPAMLSTHDFMKDQWLYARKWALLRRSEMERMNPTDPRRKLAEMMVKRAEIEAGLYQGRFMEAFPNG
jgi:hypothetical protein